ncbi:acyl-CoA dehydrogenase family protein [Jatrophihabitans lederbergiae]|uniref:Acyl-CoA dehydrogenase family protein n=1 Tax=Jatrophihabitans lederbergiae TaxID=3075547 RepID=A0ABU2JH97_9ACTN|nr:acyl-CoA dehydrogenase family protein [Jatrophihabitans sp. DSM 44399]MDT0264362.1 acyl-CoA dehydrogenase family protein [Jatrophihabitans sp. DSM 44399]
MTEQILADDPQDWAPLALTLAAAEAARYAELAEVERRLSPQVVKAIVDAGIVRHFVPTRWGGAAGTFLDFSQAIATLGEACGSAAWCASVFASAARMGAFLPLEGQHELWDRGPDSVIVGALVPGGSIQPVADGWRVSGRWPFTSGIDHADWALVCGSSSGGEDTLGPRFFAVPRSDFQIEDTWFNVGLRGTGSSTLILDSAFVPARRSFLRSDMQAGKSPDSTARCHTVLIRVFAGLTFAAPALGSARGALAAWTEGMSTRRDATGKLMRDRTTIQLTLARSAGEIDAAALLLDRVASVADHGPVDAEVMARCGRDYTLATELLVGAVERLFLSEGARGQAETGQVQRAWRDVHCAAGHVGLQFETAGAAYGAAAFARMTAPEAAPVETLPWLRRTP